MRYDSDISKLISAMTEVHISHCCSIHGCKYGDIDCPVILGLAKQKHLCEYCDDESDFNL